MIQDKKLIFDKIIEWFIYDSYRINLTNIKHY